MRTARLIALATTFGFFGGPSAGAAEPDPTARTIIAKHLEAIGGVEAQKKLTTRKSEGTAMLNQVGTLWKITVIQKAPDKKHLLVMDDTQLIVEKGTDGQEAWQRFAGNQVQSIEGDNLNYELKDARFHSGLEMIEKGEFTHEGDEEIDGWKYHVLKATFEDESPLPGKNHTLYIDRDTYLLGRMRYERELGGATVPHTIALSGYEEVDGIPVPTSMTISVNGTPFATVTFDRITHDVDVDDDLFRKPLP
ncbi:hypothetical protein Pan216_22450 [Planctomycetes bacterium Pan216]|uniref:Uncharacterized protein TP-0789 domain-containing protein n=1 Tax=Kolteria novifilia TaxID=2527975 RepID=A0A518B326_9BACT|nr:hypothetical protein Pan216_22450 [Planctomycetes bacterium Pan216]